MNKLKHHTRHTDAFTIHLKTEAINVPQKS